ncbi:GT2 family glycosyltransferase [Flavobacterium sp. CG_23.5]|uniref:glycosyltransferase family 2 protein n=1 Tax=Flavobacterium sp. CG_23.5 TaxID=2760708 RepID=UPI001AE827A8|nr:glycosyltransferase family A protein [Flavobacterium sp. CG_23.5]MBP2283027.1 GT2 family glycosyltransferase [Flavobacterium sp. CG_23.5]
MIVVYHLNSKITEVATSDNQTIEFDFKGTIADGLHILAQQFPSEIIIWCNATAKEQLNLEVIPALLHHNKMMLSYSADSFNFLDRRIGYVEESLFININKKVCYPTWQMSSFVGVVHASVVNAIRNKVERDADFDYYLNSIAKVAMPLGLLCYSEPQLLKQQQRITSHQASSYTLFRYIKQHYKTRWIFLLLINLMVHERKFPLIPMIFSFFYKNRKNVKINLEGIVVESSRRLIDIATIDVIIPTIGRANYLYDVLIDFSKQTLLPHKIIIIEQNPEPLSKSELDYIYEEKWPFKIQHFFIHQSGACNARNLALDQTESEWVFLADDDNRFEPNLLKDIFDNIKKYGSPVVTTSYPQKNESKIFLNIIQWPTFGAGNSVVKRNLLNKVRFNMGLEFGYGEDSDFGMQLRNQGYDVLYLPNPEILHLKAPIGGFRTKPVLEWHQDIIQPKPSPTVMLYILRNNTTEQFLGYKTTLFFKYYRHQKIKNPYRYFIHFKKQWNQSVFWANHLKTRT